MLRQYELLKQGDVFVEEIWNDSEKKEKDLFKDWDGKFRTKCWKDAKEENYGCAERNIISG